MGVLAEEVVRVKADTTGFHQGVQNDVEGPIKKAALVAGAAFAAVKVGDFLADAAKAAAHDEVEFTRLGTSVKNSGENWEELEKPVEKALTAMSNASGFMKGELAKSLSALELRTKDHTKALELEKDAMNISVQTGRPLQAVTMALGKAYDGSVGGLNRLGIAIPKVTTAQDKLKAAHSAAIASGQKFNETQKQAYRVALDAAKANDKDQTSVDALRIVHTKFAGAVEAQSQTMQGKLKIMGAQWENLKIQLGNIILPLIVKGLGFVLQAIQFVANASGNVKTALLAVGAAAATIGTALIVWKAYTVAVELAGKVQAAFNLIMAANPIVLVALAIAALVAAMVILYMRSQTVHDIIDNLFNTFREVVSTAWGVVQPILLAIASTIQSVFQTVSNLIENNWQAIWSVLSVAVNTAVDLVTGYINGIIQIVTGVFNLVDDLIHGRWDQVWGDLVQIVTGYLDTLNALLGGIPGYILDVISAAAGAAGDLASGIVGALTDALSGLGGLVTGWIGDVVTAVSNGVSGAATAAAGVATAIVTAITTGVANLGTAVAGGISDVATAITNAIVGITAVAASFGRAIVAGIVTGLANIVTSVMTEVAKVGTAVAGYATTATTEAVKIGAAIIKGAVQGVTGIAGEVMKVVDNITGAIATFATNIFDNAEHIGKRIVAGVVSGLVGIGDKALGVIKQVANVVNQFAQDVWNDAWRIGDRIIKGVIAGLGGLFDAVKNKIQGAIGDGISWAGDHIPGSGEGPAERAAQNHLGRPIADGVISGFVANIGGFRQEMQTRVSDAVHGIDTSSVVGGGGVAAPFGASRTTGYEQPLLLDDGGLVDKLGELVDELRASRGDSGSGVTVIATNGANAAVMAARR